MTRIRKIKETIKKNPYARVLIEERKNRRYQRDAGRCSDREYIEKLYEKNTGRKPDLDNPVLFTEKLQWLKLNYRDPTIPEATDKYSAKKYIGERGFPELVIPALAVYDSADEIDINALPDGFIIKATHGSGWNYICTDKKTFGLDSKKRVMASWLRQNLYVYGREWNYRNLKPRLIAEPLMDTKPLVDYKFLCFAGVCRAVQVNHDENGTHYVDFYDDRWNLFEDMSSGTADISRRPLPEPELFAEMKKTAEELARPFPFVRVDLYDIGGKMYFGEMTFFPGSGFWNITPVKYDRMFGEWLELPGKTGVNPGD